MFGAAPGAAAYRNRPPTVPGHQRDRDRRPQGAPTATTGRRGVLRHALLRSPAAGKGLRLGPNVMLVFKPAPNVVYCSWPLLFVNVVQYCLGPNLVKISCFGKKIARAAKRRRANQNFRMPYCQTEGLIGDGAIPWNISWSTFCQFSRFGTYVSKFGSISSK